MDKSCQPLSIYSITVSKDFDLQHIQSILEYLSFLGIKTIALSPVLKSIKRNSGFVYTTDPTQLDHEIGTLKEAKDLGNKLSKLGMGWLQEMSPGIMAFSLENKWLPDVFKKGLYSDYSGFFEINWDHPKKIFKNKIIIPCLEMSLNEAIESQELMLEYDHPEFVIRYLDDVYPLNYPSYAYIFAADTNKSPSDLPDPLINLFTDPEKWQEAEEKIKEAFELNRDFKDLIKRCIEAINENKAKLRELINLQYYHLAPKNEPALNINYERIGDSNYLIKLNLENQSVFREVHSMIGTLIKENIIDGVIVYHTGLPFARDAYFKKLREMIGLHPCVITDAKITQNEINNSHLPIEGTTEYDFYDASIGLYLNEEKIKTFQKIYAKWIRKKTENKDNQKPKQNIFQFWETTTGKWNLIRLMGVLSTSDQRIPKELLLDNDLHYFHKIMKTRQQVVPNSLNSICSLNNVVGEDAIFRLMALSNFASEWKNSIKTWRKQNASFKPRKEILNNLVSFFEYDIYQFIVISIPGDLEISNDYLIQFKTFISDLVLNYKQYYFQSVTDQDALKVTLGFVQKILNAHSDFMRLLRHFMKNVMSVAIHYSLNNLILKSTCPGVPTFSPGSENWDLHLGLKQNTDPENFQTLKYQLGEMIRESDADHFSLLSKIWTNRADGRIKLFLTHLLLKERKNNPQLFRYGEYIPLKVSGKHKTGFIAFLRHHKQKYLLVILPVFQGINPLQIIQNEKTDYLEKSYISLPAWLPNEWQNILINESRHLNGETALNEVLSFFPFAFLKSEKKETSRKAGILNHITSLPGKYGMGDFGQVSFEWIDFLHKTGQQFWQVLPLNPVSAEYSFSPYSSYSAFAGNEMLINPDPLKTLALLPDNYRINTGKIKNEQVDFINQAAGRSKMLYDAWLGFNASENNFLKESFNAFCSQQEYWLKDYACFIALKEHFNQKSWYEWDAPFRDRNQNALDHFVKQNSDAIRKIKYTQFLFQEQWKAITAYANVMGISIIGDIPIYVSYDSADVWAHPDLFQLTKKKEMKVIAGVPPDYFNQNGQLWNMPVFDWDKMKSNGFAWWVQRIKRNMELYDLLRIDHFRGFSAYWEVPQNEETAVNGKWVKGPGAELFEVIRQHFPEMRFIAEDLGKIDQDVYDLRDQFGLPGMKVLQFAFDKNMPYSTHIPHNYEYNSIAYTGTHDNNTLMGWLHHEVNNDIISRIKAYTDKNPYDKKWPEDLIRLVMASAAKIAIIPMQDYLGLGAKARMNFPSTKDGNWTWRMESNDLGKKIGKRILSLTNLYGRF